MFKLNGLGEMLASHVSYRLSIFVEGYFAYLTNFFRWNGGLWNKPELMLA